MVLPILFANLRKEVDQSSSIAFLDIQSKANEFEDQINDHNILGFFRISDELDSQLLDEKLRKASSKGKLALKVCQLLNWNSFESPTREEDALARNNFPFVYCGKTAVLGGPPFEGRARDIEGISRYQELQFTFSKKFTMPANADYTSTQILHFSCPTLRLEDAASTQTDQPLYDHVEILSGMCLFNAHILESALSASRGVDAWKLVSQKATLYEMEYIARASSAIADLTSTFTLKGRDSYLRQDGLYQNIRIHLDIPSFHYYHSIHEKIQGGMCTFSDALEWVNAVERRHDQVSKVFEKSIRQEISRRRVSIKSSYDIQLSPKSNLVALSIRRALESGEIPCFDKVLQELNRQEDPLWRSFVSFLSSKEMPHDFRSLGHLFYVFEAVRPALAERKGQTNDLSKPEIQPRLLLLSVDDAAERRIYSRSQKLLKKFRQSGTFLLNPTLVEIYMSRRVFINNNIAGSNLYLDDPTPERPTLIALNSPHSRSENNKFEPFEPIDVVRILYGNDCAWNIQRLFAEVGL